MQHLLSTCWHKNRSTPYMWTCHWSMVTQLPFFRILKWSLHYLQVYEWLVDRYQQFLLLATQLNLDSSPTASIVVAIKTFCFSGENVPLVAAGKGLANLSKYSASYFSEKKGFKTIFFTADLQLYTNAWQGRIYKNRQQWDLSFFFYYEKFPLFTGKLYLPNPY